MLQDWDSPSPAPEYDGMGVRTNTRAKRTREKLLAERDQLIRACIAVDPLLSHYRPPPDFELNQKKTAKLFAEDILNTTQLQTLDEMSANRQNGRVGNLMGLILGPRGHSHQRMCLETKCRIELRGKGSVKDGAQPKMAPKADDGSNEDFHVFITGPDDECVERAIDGVKSLVPTQEKQLLTNPSVCLCFGPVCRCAGFNLSGLMY